MDTGEFFLPFSTPKLPFLWVMDANKIMNTNRKIWRREDLALSVWWTELKEKNFCTKKETIILTTFGAIVCFVLLRYCIDIVCMVLDCYSKSKQTQSNTHYFVWWKVCVVKLLIMHGYGAFLWKIYTKRLLTYDSMVYQASQVVKL